PQAILGRNEWLDFEEEYGHIIKANPQELPESEQRLYQEAHDLLHHFGHDLRLHAEVILEAEVGLEDIDVYGRNEAIQAAEVAAGLKPELLREMVWVEGAEDIPGVIVLPQDDYKRVYVLEG